MLCRLVCSDKGCRGTGRSSTRWSKDDDPQRLTARGTNRWSARLRRELARERQRVAAQGLVEGDQSAAKDDEVSLAICTALSSPTWGQLQMTGFTLSSQT